MPTARVNLDNQSYVNLGAGPLHVSVGQLQSVRLHFGVAAPAVGTLDFIPAVGPSGRDYDGDENVYARAEGDAAFVVVVSGAA